LLDRQGPETTRKQIVDALENDQDRKVTDLHIWSIGPGIYSAIISIVAHQPRTTEAYKSLIPHQLGVVHAAIEITTCKEGRG
jgi:Co/Zn/Cd efflux system component